MQSEKKIEAAARADAEYAGRTFDALSSAEKTRFRERAKLMLEAALSTDAEPVNSRNDEAGYVEFLNEDVPYVVRDIDGRCAILTDLETRKYIGYRVYEPEPVEPAPAGAVKALEWTRNNSRFIDACCPVGHYEIQLGGSAYSFSLNDRYTRQTWPSLSEAKAAAQADYEARIRSVLSAQVQDVAVPDGWQLVPKEPTQEMLDACGPKPEKWDATPTSKRVRESADYMRRLDYKTMLAASPAPKHGEEG